MSVLSVARNAATKIGIQVPTQVFSSATPTMVQLQTCINSAAEMIRDEYDWQALQKTTTITGDGSEESFPLPIDFQRMLTDADLWPSSRPTTPMTHILTAAGWLRAEQQVVTNPYGEWSLFGDRVHIRPVLPDQETVKFVYVSNWIVRPTSGNNKQAFTDDTDVFGLSERLLELAVVWTWKASKNQSYAKELQDYETALMKLLDRDKGSKPVLSGGGENRRVKSAWPWVIREAS